MKGKYYILINIRSPFDSTLAKSIKEVADIVGCHRNTLKPETSCIRGGFIIVYLLK